MEDNPPQFDPPVWHRHLKEALYRKGRRIDLPKAFDKDLMSIYRIIKYRLEPGPHETMFHFEMNGKDTPSLVLKEDLDAETQLGFNMTLVAFNPSPASQMMGSFLQNDVSESKLKIRIVVIDMNDNEPFFKNTNYNITVLEDTPTGSIIFQVSISFTRQFIIWAH